MIFFNNLSTRAKLFLSFGLIWVMLLTIIIIAYSSIQKITTSENDLYRNDFMIAFKLREIRAHQNFNRAEILEMMMVQEKSEQLAIEKVINERSEIVNKLIENLFTLEQEPLFQSQLKELKDLLINYRNIRSEEIALVQAGKIEEARELGTTSGSIQFEKIRSIATTMGEKATNDAETQLSSDQQAAASSTLLFIIIGIVALLFSIILILLMNKSIATPLNIISGIARRIANGDLSTEVREDERKDEVGILNNAFYNMVQKLRISIKDIIEGVNMLGSSASEILAATTQVASGAAETATAISETTTTVEEVRQASQLSSQKANKVSENSQQVAQVTQIGQKAVDETIAGMHDIQNQMEAMANTIIRLSEQSQQIGGIIASVNDVADQSNLLAVNAAIEAAKAGEYGKGFTVVAQEIKSLALQSKQATSQVRTILSDVQKATSAAVMAAEQTSKAVENGVKQSAQAGDAIKKLTESSTRAIDAAIQIVASSQQQAVGMDQIGLAMNNINQAGMENTASMVQAEKAAKSLHELGKKLEFLVEQYKI